MLKGEVHGMRIRTTVPVRTGIRERLTFDLFLDDRKVGNIVWFKGRMDYLPWLELDYDPWPRRIGAEVGLFSIIHNFLPPGGRFFVTYTRDHETQRLLFMGRNPILTPLGFSMLQAGFTWFKDWYFPEGGNEASAKLQGNRPLSLQDKIRQLRERLTEAEESGDREISDWIRETLSKLLSS